MAYNIIVSGGTFDHFHNGHKTFLRKQLALSSKLLIGLTSDVYSELHKKGLIESYEVRLQHLKNFLLRENAWERVEIQKIDDVYIPAAWSNYSIEAIAVTPDSVSGALQINQKRITNGQEALPYIEIPYVLAQDGKRISASRIRTGEISSEGEVYLLPEWLTSSLVLPESLREIVAKPFGTLYTTVATLPAYRSDAVVSIGDVTTHELIKRKFGQKVSVIDLYVQRVKVYKNSSAHGFSGNETILPLKNLSGQITPALFYAAQKSLFEPGRFVILIEGEEDLAVLPFVIVAPLNTHILYGQPGEGIIDCEVTPEKKKQAHDILKQFTILASK